ncbi:MAG: hypothetical protein JSU65_05055 [Candidatus Zixiibacteriota bacterium]|nr:MAG: hypothetical protein JSU65_05055 [candidate division Zixibacteria bacterium]
MMRLWKVLAAVLILALSAGSLTVAQDTEEDFIARYLQDKPNKAVKEKQKVGWASVSFGMNRINRENDYNTFATLESEWITGGSLSWLDRALFFGGEAGTVFAKKFYVSLGGEYWLKLGEELTGTFFYTRTGVPLTNPASEIKVMGAYLGAGWYLYNPPAVKEHVTRLTVRIGGTAGLYVANWDLWPEYRNLNLATNTPVNANTTFRGTAPGLTFNLGAEYPVGWAGLVAALDVNYLYLNFKNVAWYNASDEEVVVTFDGTADGRVDLALSGVRGKFEIKRYFNW